MDKTFTANAGARQSRNDDNMGDFDGDIKKCTSYRIIMLQCHGASTPCAKGITM